MFYRLMGMKRLIRAGLRRAGRCMKQSPALMNLVKPDQVPRNDFLRKLKWVMFDPAADLFADSSFSRIRFQDFDLLFANGPLADPRGIGRVCREQLRALTKLSGLPVETVQQAEAGTGTRRSVHFYTSIHWCPDVLPSNTVVMIHDVIPLMFPKQFGDVIAEWKNRFKAIAAQAGHIVTISESSAQEISRFLEVPREKITAIYNGVTQLPAGDPAEAAVTLPAHPYVVFFGAYGPHKNMDIVLQALARDEISGVDLVAIGDNKNRTVLRKVEALGLASRVHFMGKLNDAQAGHVLTCSKGLVFPSLYEGFGLPPMEAALLGVPSICSNRPAMNETMADVALFVEPDDVQGWSNAIHRLVSEAGLGSELGQAARSRVLSFTWDAAARKLLDVLTRSAK
ncbi:glycosyltransferase family 4 protein [Herbaspirillum frisingense]|uniref:glycosyltransferase family 4 protein n=1 Tax=Herbaspirillum frisingense TaxID=92645 RepID=UPI0039AEAD0E